MTFQEAKAEVDNYIRLTHDRTLRKEAEQVLLAEIYALREALKDVLDAGMDFSNMTEDQAVVAINNREKARAVFDRTKL